ncbi:hypothetical protein [Streptomyces sp. NPDC050704]|uniref:hypothetical protein n=1 Tax=Streptomyces sp. NPDC050704 TaxID=3157219 RepID=UPI00341C195D
MKYISVVLASTAVLLAVATMPASAADEQHVTATNSQHLTQAAAADQVMWSSRQVRPQQVMW